VKLDFAIVIKVLICLGGIDYELQSSSVTIPAGATKASFDVAILDDMVHETNETFHLKIGTLSNGAIRGYPGQAEVIILNDDGKH